MPKTALTYTASDLSYCTNVHPGEGLDDVIENLTNYVGPVRDQLELNHLHAGLWLSYQAVKDCDQRGLKSLQSALSRNKLSVHSINAFPLGNFHSDVVKENVYLPDWSEQSRYDYTLEVANILAKCLDKDTSKGTISTVPLGFKAYWTKEKHQACIKNLCNLALSLATLEQQTGKQIQVCLEMEPACVLQFTHEIIDFFNHDLKQVAAQENISPSVIYRYLGVCYDVCHQAVMFEDISTSLHDIHQSGIDIGKIQLSSALSTRLVSADKAAQLLQEYVEPRYLHQTSIQPESGCASYYQDLELALESYCYDDSSQWRVHYHVPLQLQQINNQGLATTQFALKEVFDFLSAHKTLKPHLEIETYTWKVLPQQIRPHNDASLIAGVCEEFKLCMHKMTTSNLLR